MANDHFNSMEPSGKYKVIGGIISPVSNGYGKKSLISAEDRLEMCRLATEEHPFVTVESWETLNPEWTPTFNVLKHFDEMIKPKIPNIKIMLLCGSDLVSGFDNFNIWDPNMLKELIETFGLVVIERKDTLNFNHLTRDIFESDTLFSVKRNIFIIPQMISTEISSSKLRLLVKRGFSIKYLTFDSVIEYIHNNKLYIQ